MYRITSSASKGVSETEHNFCQLQHTGWPDYGAPQSTSSVFLLVKALRKLIDLKQGKNFNVLVHCSSGTGRSGTFVALYYLMEMIDQKVAMYKSQLETPTTTAKSGNDEDISIDVFNTVFNITKERCEMVWFH